MTGQAVCTETRISLMLDLAPVWNTQPYLIVVACPCRKDNYNNLCIHSQSGNVVVITASMLFCVAHSPLLYNVLHSSSNLKSSTSQFK